MLRPATAAGIALILALVLGSGCERSGPTPAAPGSGARQGTPSGPTAPTGPGAADGAKSEDRGAAPADERSAAGDATAATRPPAAIVTPDQMVAALKEKNRGFGGEHQMEPISADLLGLVINDPQVKDITPLARQRLGILDLSKCDISDLSPLEGLPLMQLFLEDNPRLADISALRGMPLQKLYLSRTRVENLGSLRGAPLEDLNLLGTQVKDLSPLAECPLKMLWLTGCPVEDISPLRRLPLVSLTLQDTRVKDLSPLEGHSLQRLHIGGTEVSDLTPLASLRLTRLIFTPGKIKTGLDVVRKMTTLQELGTRFDDAADDKMPPATFWELYDKGELK